MSNQKDLPALALAVEAAMGSVVPPVLLDKISAGHASADDWATMARALRVRITTCFNPDTRNACRVLADKLLGYDVVSLSQVTDLLPTPINA